MKSPYDLCVSYLGARGCDRSDYTDEVRRTGAIVPGVLDTYEVTNAEFADFIRRSQYETTAEQRGTSWLGGFSAKDLSWRQPTHGESHADRPDHPVVHVTRFDAQKYCKFHGKRLPTELEWEYAARGAERRVFPWGDTWDPANAVWQGQFAERVEGSRRVGSHRGGRSWGELYDMAGNVWEWTATDIIVDGEIEAFAKGGSWYEVNPAFLRSAARLQESPTYSSSDIGFRCLEEL